MNEMYDMGIVTHYYGVIGIFGVFVLNVVMLLNAKNIKKYKRFNSLFMPIGMTAIGGVIFTGIVLMAAKHLDFTAQNIVMIVYAVFLIALENIRSKKLQRLDNKDEYSLRFHKPIALKIIATEFVFLLSVSAWMLM